MTASPWLATIVVRLTDPEEARRLFRTLRPEAEREVPRAETAVTRPSGRELRLVVRASDVGAVRAAVNTHLGWLSLVRSTGEVLGRTAGDESAAAPAKRLSPAPGPD